LERISWCFEQVDRKKLNQASILLALSVTACLSFIVPVLGLALIATLAMRRRSIGRDLWLPMLVFLFVLLAIPLNRALLTDFPRGATSLRQTLTELTAFSLNIVNPPAVLIRVAIGLLLAGGVVLAIRRGLSDPILLLASGTALIGLLLLLLAHAKIKA